MRGTFIMYMHSHLVRPVGIRLLGGIHSGMRIGISGGRRTLAGLHEQGGPRESGRRGVRVRELRAIGRAPSDRIGAKHDVMD